MAVPQGRGIRYQFDAAKFRNAIGFVFEMETPPVPTEQIYFHFRDAKSVVGPADSDYVPFDPTQAPTKVTRPPVHVPCDVAFTPAGDALTAFGELVPAKVKVLLLDTDYAKVKDAIYVMVNGDRYDKLFEEPSFGLFQVGLHTIVYQASNET